MHERLHRWSFVAATLGLMGAPAVAQAAGPHAETSEVRGSNDGPNAPAAAAAAVPVAEAESERTVTTVTAIAPEASVDHESRDEVRGKLVRRDPANDTWSGGAVTQGGSRVQVVTTTTVHSSPYAVQHHHHHHHQPQARGQTARPSTEAQPQAMHSVPRFAAYPYAGGAAGHVERVPWPTGTPAVGSGSPQGRLFHGQASIEGGNAGSGLMRAGGNMRLGYWRIAADGTMSYVFDRHSNDAMYVGSGNLMFAAILRPRLVWWVGGGANYGIDARPNDQGHHAARYGYNLTTSVDFFPARPLVLSGRMDMGRLGDEAVMAGRATAGLMLSRFEVYGGYQLQRIGQDTLRGPTLGLRVWF